MRTSADDHPDIIAQAIEGKLGGMVHVMRPAECDEPILAPSVQAAVFEWMTESRMAKELRSVGLKARSTCLLSGPPGCGKTTLAHHFAARLGMPLVVVRGEVLQSQYVGQTGQSVAKLFDVLRAYDGKVVGFLDEMDALASKRIDQGTSAAREQNAIVTALLTNIEALGGLFFGATNRADAIDPAIWRRFGMQIEVALPGFDERFAILLRYGHPFSFDPQLIDELAMVTNGAAPSLLRQLMEGVKRALVLGPKLRGRDVSSARAVIGAVVRQVQPHPEYMQPPYVAPDLWKRPETLDRLNNFSWPPEIKS